MVLRFQKAHGQVAVLFGMFIDIGNYWKMVATLYYKNDEMHIRIAIQNVRKYLRMMAMMGVFAFE